MSVWACRGYCTSKALQHGGRRLITYDQCQTHQKYVRLLRCDLTRRLWQTSKRSAPHTWRLSEAFVFYSSAEHGKDGCCHSQLSNAVETGFFDRRHMWNGWETPHKRTFSLHREADSTIFVFSYRETKTCLQIISQPIWLKKQKQTFSHLHTLL